MQIKLILSVAKWFHQDFTSNIYKIIDYSNEFCNAVILFIIANDMRVNAFRQILFVVHKI